MSAEPARHLQSADGTAAGGAPAAVAGPEKPPAVLPGSGRPSEPAAPPKATRDATPVRWVRVAALAVPLIVLNSYWIANSEMKTGVTEVTISTLFMGVVFLLLGVVALNALVGWARPRAALNQAELLVLYIMLSMSSSVSGVGAIGFFLPFLGNITWYNNPINGWDRFDKYLPWWFAPTDKQHVLRPFYLGNSSFFHPLFMRAWAVPLTIWFFVFLTLIFVTLCASSLLRAQWIDAEHLPFPMVMLPVEMSRRDGSFFQNRLLWIGFAIPFAIQTMNTLNSMYPSIPSWHINTLVDYHSWFQEKPWSGVDSVMYSIHPCGVGLTFIVPLDMSFSAWFFYALKKLLNVMGVAAGWRDPNQGWFGDQAEQFPFTGFQAWGAWLAMAAMSLWMARGHLKRAFHKALHGDPRGEDAGELFTSRQAVCGLLLGMAALCGFCYAMGAPLWIPPVFLTLYLILMTVLTRIIAEVGPPSTELIWVNPQNMLTKLLGTKAFNIPGLVDMATLSCFNIDYRAAAMPHQMEALRAAGLSRMRLRPLAAIILFAAAVALVSALICCLQMYYVNGAATAKVNGWRTSEGNQPWNWLDNWQRNPKGPDPVAWTAAAVGAGVLVALTVLRSRIIGFPFHPAAYALNTTFAVDFFWGDFFLGWLLKMLILRYGGMRAYRNALPFFLGLILGDFTAGAGWSMVGAFLHLNLFRTFAT